MEALFAFFALVSMVAIVLGPVLALVALSRVRRAERELAALRRELARRGAEGAAPASAPSPAPALPFRREPLEVEPHEPPPARVERPAPAPRPTAPREPAPRPTLASLAALEPPAPPRRAPRAPIAWEQWIGVRGAAVLGGLVLALAGLFLFLHAFERGWITPAMRVGIGVAVGAAAIGAGELFQRRGYRFAPAASAAGGVVVLYASTWAAYSLYGFLSALAALPLMALVTAGCALLATRFRSQLVAVLGLVGGFATPLLLSVDAQHPIGLFGYLLLLDLGLLALGQRMRWPLLGLLGMLGTFFVELVWSTQRLDAELLPLALGSLAAFALLFAAAGMRSPAGERRRWLASQAGALLLPFAFATYFATLADLGERLWPLGLLLAVLAWAASWIGARQGEAWLASGAAAGALAVTGTWLVSNEFGAARPWETALTTVGLTAVFLLAERVFGRSREVGTRWAAPLAPVVVAVGFGITAWGRALFGGAAEPWPLLVAALGQAAALHVVGARPRAGGLRLVGAALAGLAFVAHLHHAPAPAPDASLLPSLLPVLLGLAAFGAAAWTTRGEDEANARWSWHAAALAAALVLVFGPECAPSTEPYLWEAWLVTLGVTALVLLPAARRANGAWYALALAAYGLRRAHWLSLLLWDPQRAPLAGGLWLLEVAALGAFAALPLALRRGLGARATTAAGLAVFLFLSYGLHGRLLDAHFDGDHVWQAPAALGLLALGLGLVGRLRLGRGARDGWARAQLAVAAFWLALALTHGLAPDHHEAVATLALAGAGLIALWRWLPALWLKLAALALTAFSVATLGLELGRAFGGDDVFEGGAWLAWNWTSYATALPALAALVGAVAWSRHERAHLVNGEVQLLRGRRAWAATVAGLATAGLVFLWLNLQVYVWFEPGAWLRLDEPYGQARDLTLSIVWVLYALGLLAIGMARRAGGLRQVSLAFLLLTLVKVFLRDLGDLEGLYRVGSLFGLALSLLLVSLLYQRFVFPRRSRTGEAVEGGVA